jgi:hypothetical protein
VDLQELAVLGLDLGRDEDAEPLDRVRQHERIAT